MLSVKNRMQKAERNRKFVLQKLVSIIETYPDWVTVVTFYSALHFVDAHLLKHHGIQREHHAERERDVADHMRDVYPTYKRLFELAFRSRYLRIEDNPSPEEAKSAVECDLPEIEEYVKERIS